MLRTLLLLSFCFAGSLLLAQTANVHYVNQSAATFGDGSSWDMPFQYIQDALDASEPGDEIWVAAGTYVPGGATPSRTTWLEANEDFQLYGGFAGTETERAQRDPAANLTVISGDVNGDDSPGSFTDNVTDNLQHLMVIDTVVTNASTVDGFTLTRGITDGSSGSGDGRRGGGMLIFGSPVIRNCAFVGNYGWFGGGAYPRGSGAVSTKVIDCLFDGNGGGSGGGMYAVGGDGLEVVGSDFEGNIVENTGAALRFQDAQSGSIRDCEFFQNTAGSSGGAVNLLRFNGDVVDCEFIENTGNFGGALVNYTDGAVAVGSCRFEGNESAASGGAVSLAFGSQTTFTDCEFSQNTSGASAGAVYIQGAQEEGDSEVGVDFLRCVFEENEATSSAGAVWSRYSSLVTFEGCALLDNFAMGSAGAVYVGPDSLDLGLTIIEQTSVIGNIAEGQGGAFDIINADLEVVNTLIAANTSGAYGGSAIVNSTDSLSALATFTHVTFVDNESEEGVEVAGFTTDTSDAFVDFRNCLIVSVDDAFLTEDGSPAPTSEGGNVVLASDPEGVFAEASDQVIVDLDPVNVFADYNGEDYSLPFGSVAIDAGLAGVGLPDDDILGMPRDDRPDAGAYEYDGSVSARGENLASAHLVATPNPSSAWTRIDLTGIEIPRSSAAMSIALASADGRAVPLTPARVVLREQSVRLDLSALPAGVYYLTVHGEAAAGVARIVKF